MQRGRKWSLLTLIAVLVAGILTSAPAIAAAPITEAPPHDLFTITVDLDRLEIHRETDTPNKSTNADEPVLITIAYEFAFGDASSASAEFLDFFELDGKDARENGGVAISDDDGRFELDPIPVGGEFAAGTITVILESDACSGPTYRLLGQELAEALEDALGAFVTTHETLGSLLTTPREEALTPITDALDLELSLWQKAKLGADCFVNSWVLPTTNFDDALGLGATMTIGLDPNLVTCKMPNDFSGRVGPEPILDFVIESPIPLYNFTTKEWEKPFYPIFDKGDVWFEAAIMQKKSFEWNLNDDDGRYSVSGTIDVSPSVDGPDCATFLPEPDPTPTAVPIPHGCFKLELDLERGVIDFNTFQRLSRELNCPTLAP